jgi:hypothetical protein
MVASSDTSMINPALPETVTLAPLSTRRLRTENTPSMGAPGSCAIDRNPMPAVTRLA